MNTRQIDVYDKLTRALANTINQNLQLSEALIIGLALNCNPKRDSADQRNEDWCLEQMKKALKDYGLSDEIISQRTNAILEKLEGD